jgi:signal transduction histidine kinase
MRRKDTTFATNKTILRLKVLAKKKEGVRSKLAATAREKESIGGRLAVTAKKLALIAREKEVIKRKLEITAEKLRLKAKQLAVTAAEKEDVRSKLAITAKEKEGIRRKLAVIAQQLAVIAKEKENIRRKLEVTARQLAATAKEKEDTRSKLAIVAKQLAATAEEKEDVRSKLAITAKELATTAEEKEGVRRKLAITAKELAVTAEEKEGVRRKLAVTAKQLAVTAEEREDIRRKLAVTAKQLAVTAKEIESANTELRLLDLAKDEFVSIASHQLRTPLTALKGFTGMLLDGDAGPINEKQQEYLREIRNANNRMIALITALLNVSRVDLGAFSVDPELVNFEKVSQSVLKELEMKIGEKNLRVETNFEKGLPLLSVDPKIIRMIFQNLLSNAVKYTPPEGRITLTIKKDGSTIRISVADTGYGIPESAQSKIFGKLFRADNARTKDPEGTGLGLYIIKATIERTGGKIWFESKENKGSTFYVSIPLEGMQKRGGSRRLE